MEPAGLFIDVENLGGRILPRLVQAVAQAPGVGRLCIRRAYSSRWNEQPVKTKEGILALGLDPIIVTERTKNSADEAIKTDIDNLLQNIPCVGVYIIASGDRGFRASFAQIRARKKRAVLCCPETGASIALRKACDRFIPIPTSDGSGMAQQASLASATTAFNGGKHTIGVRAGEINVNRRVLDMIQGDYREKLSDGGVPIASLSKELRAFKDPRAGKRRWLIKLLISATNGDEELCLAHSGSGDCRVFASGCVPDGWLVLDE